MRRSITAGATAALLVWSSVGAALAQGDTGFGDTSYQRIESPDAGLAITVPGDWKADHRRDRIEEVLPPEYADVSPAVSWSVLLVSMPGTEGFCSLSMLADPPMGLEEWVRFKAPEGAGTIVTSVQLPIGPAIRSMDDPDLAHDVAIFLNGFLYVFESGGALFESGTSNSYLLDASGERVQLMCNDPVHPPQDDFLSIAQTIVVTGAEPEIASADFVSGFSSVVEVGDGRLMRADCELALWAEYEDGTFREWLSCWLSSEPVDDPADQGTWPGELVSISGDACEWVSDYWAVTDGSETWAEAYELSVTPEGRVFGSSTYGPEVLDCTDE